ncbi:MAG TPA: hypothetical protein VFT42_07745 [Solirubrobacteraceae bacterium]|nr:hypothetical protein [Solirubrobacteraceae bacterium]
MSDPYAPDTIGAEAGPKPPQSAPDPAYAPPPPSSVQPQPSSPAGRPEVLAGAAFAGGLAAALILKRIAS